MEERTSGLILRTRPLTESSLIVHWLTRDFGRIATVAKGARRPKSPFLGKLDLFYLADFTYLPSRRSELHTLRELRVREHHPWLRQELGFLQQTAYFTQLLEETTETNTPLPDLFLLLTEVLSVLPQGPPHAAPVLAFEWRLLVNLGLDPDAGRTQRLSPGALEILRRLAAAEWSTIGRLRLTGAQLNEIGSFLERTILYHFGRLPKTRSAALHHL